MTLGFSLTDFRKILQYQISWKSVRWIRVRCLWNLDVPWQIFEKYCNIKFHENPCSGFVTCQWNLDFPWQIFEKILQYQISWKSVKWIRVTCQWNLDFPWQIFEKYCNNKFHENPTSGSRVLPCGRTFMTKLTLSFRNFSNAPKTSTLCPDIAFMCCVRISEQTAITSLYTIYWLVFITETAIVILRGKRNSG
jgi:hypothetical protein